MRGVAFLSSPESPPSAETLFLAARGEGYIHLQKKSIEMNGTHAPAAGGGLAQIFRPAVPALSQGVLGLFGEADAAARTSATRSSSARGISSPPGGARSSTVMAWMGSQRRPPFRSSSSFWN